MKEFSEIWIHEIGQEMPYFLKQTVIVMKWDKIFESGLGKFWGRQPLKKSRYIVWSRPYPLKVFKGCLPQNLLGPLLNTLLQIMLKKLWNLSVINGSVFMLWCLFEDTVGTLTINRSISDQSYKSIWMKIQECESAIKVSPDSE